MVSKYQAQQTVSLEQREQMIVDHLPQVQFIASRIHERLPRHVQIDDLISAGILGLISAVDNFDPGRNLQHRRHDGGFSSVRERVVVEQCADAPDRDRHLRRAIE